MYLSRRKKFCNITRMKYLIIVSIAIFMQTIAFAHCTTCSVGSKPVDKKTSGCSHHHHHHSKKAIELSESSQKEYDRIMSEFHESSKKLIKSARASLKNVLSESEFESVMQTKPFKPKHSKKH